jgi:glutamate synthase (NADPH/NADH) large chain
MIGRVDRLDVAPAVDHWKAAGIDLSRLLYETEVDASVARWNSERQNHGLDAALDHALIAAAGPAFDGGAQVRIEQPIRNINRTVGAMLSGQIARRFGHQGLPDDTISVRFTGVARVSPAAG